MKFLINIISQFNKQRYGDGAFEVLPIGKTLGNFVISVDFELFPPYAKLFFHYRWPVDFKALEERKSRYYKKVFRKVIYSNYLWYW